MSNELFQKLRIRSVISNFQLSALARLHIVMPLLSLLGGVANLIPPITGMDIKAALDFVINRLPAKAQLTCNFCYWDACRVEGLQLLPFIPGHVMLLLHRAFPRPIL